MVYGVNRLNVTHVSMNFTPPYTSVWKLLVLIVYSQPCLSRSSLQVTMGVGVWPQLSQV